ncbi:hypothetical protein MLD38_039739 [Melastoma candidum]|uniref:Uncharacterized protein n=1 Tax=Melastoma candidum TaxID=119954 RepID=A0ACB9L3X5_9MYRT|nr:hypothetical protein MLD38_039739 [Melastoma candidum]
MLPSRNSVLLLVPVLILIAGFSEAAPPGSRIDKLPGFVGSFPSQHYAGYVTIEGKPGKKNLFYYFIASERSPSKDPVVLWLNGGPGCSSFDGFVYEHGPFLFHSGLTPGSLPILRINPYSWSKVSNIIYLDSPCGVGLSYSDNPINYATTDLRTASDTHHFLLKWFELYPEFLSNPFYISGESYAGVYVPTLALEVVNGIEKAAKPLINFKGYLIGNGVADVVFDGNSHVPFAHAMALISDDIFETSQRTCEEKYYDPPSSSCVANLAKVRQALVGLNRYDILEPCYQSPGTSFSNSPEFDIPMFPGKRKALSTRDSTSSGSESQPYHVPCVNDVEATTWLNDEAVRKAIHAAPASVAGAWAICAVRVMERYSSDTDSMIPYHLNLTSKGYRALIYSGDHDMAVPYPGTQAWTRSLGYSITEEWRSWHTENQVAGYLQGYDKNLTFLTVKGAGHMVPQSKPREALHFYSQWLDYKPI